MSLLSFVCLVISSGVMDPLVQDRCTSFLCIISWLKLLKMLKFPLRWLRKGSFMIMLPLVGPFQGLFSEPFVSGFQLGVRCTSFEKECVLTNECTQLTETITVFLSYCYECSSFGWLSKFWRLVYLQSVDRCVELLLFERNCVFRINL